MGEKTDKYDEKKLTNMVEQLANSAKQLQGDPKKCMIAF